VSELVAHADQLPPSAKAILVLNAPPPTAEAPTAAANSKSGK
jgi:hypothetical protein